MGIAQRKLQEEDHCRTIVQNHEHLSEAEVTNLHACFLSRFNCCQISEAAFIRYYHEVYADSLRNPLVTHLLRRIECQKPGYIHFDDFVRAFGTVRYGSAQERMDWLFSIYAENDNNDMADKLELLELVRTVYRVSFTVQNGDMDKREVAHSAEERMRRAFFADQNLERLLSRAKFKDSWVNNDDIWQVTIETVALLLQELFDGMKKPLGHSPHASANANASATKD